MNQQSFRLGFDGGGTKTRAVVIDENAEVLGAGESGSSNPYAIGMDGALDNIEAAADLALSQAGMGREAIEGWGLGLGGVCSRAESLDVENALRARLGEGAKIRAAEDVEAAWSGAFGGEQGGVRLICIAGTGSNCWGKNERGESAGADGAGPLLGDRGSGYRIGEYALRHTSAVADGLFAPDALSAGVLSHFEVANVKELIRVVYAPDFARSRIAGLVPVVLQNAETPSAHGILTTAGEELAQTALAVLRRLSGENEVGGEIALIGGVLAHAAPVLAAFSAALRREAPGARLVEARYEPAVGAALLV